ncbi:unnamed protein product [Debaryomyces tyrocola]|nr:unnamed protein product [Debaryomyces tyrocola]
MSKKYPTYESKFSALMERNPDAEGEFIYCVLSTSICCRPTCSSRLPLKKNIIFCDSVEEAIERRFRPCKRCRPHILVGWNKTREKIKKACLIIMKMATSKTKLDVDKLAVELRLSKWYFCRTFKNYTGYTPKKFYEECIQGSNPLIFKPLPLIRTKKNLQKQRELSRKNFPERVIENKKSSAEIISNDNNKYFTSMQIGGAANIPKYDTYLEMFECLEEDIALNPLDSFENSSASTDGDTSFYSKELLDYMNIEVFK